MLGQKSDTSKKNASSAKNSDAELNKNKRGLVKGPKPLQRLKFYLDVKNHAVTSKLEEKIKELGGAVEFFLDREVTHVISDRPQYPNNATLDTGLPSTPRLRSVDSNFPNVSPIFVCESPTGRLRQKTRADAMLEKVRSQSTNKVRDPLQNAKLWGIPIWNVNKILSWLEKVSASTVSTQKKKSVKVINITAPFLKFEPIARNARPVYKTIQSWPTLDLESSPGKPVFLIKSEGSQALQKNLKTDKTQQKSEAKTTEKNQGNPESTNDCRMTRIQRTRLSVRGAGKEQEIDKQALVGGFCEICHCEYREIAEHVRSEQHLNFIKNDANFLELDSLISAGANVEAFLRLNGTSGKDLNNLFCRRSLRKLNGKSSPEKCNGSLDGYSPPITRNKMPRTRGSLNSPRSPTTCTDTVHHLRSRGQIWLPTNLIGTTAEDEPYVNNKKEKSNRSSSKLTDDESKNAKENETEKKIEIGRPKRACPKTKRISADDRLVADNKTYYKVEVMTTKLRSSGLGNRETELARRAQTPIPEESQSEEQGLVVKFKRVRRSELSVLNDEAENFMFPRKEDSSNSEGETDEGPNTTRSSDKTESSDIVSSELDIATKSRLKPECDDHDESSLTSCDTEILSKRKLKRKRSDTSKSSVSEEDPDNSIDNFVSEIGLRRKNRRTYTEDVDETLDESSKDGSVVCESEGGGRKKKRRTHAEMFIADNQRYYKFETPGSRLRYQGMFFTNMIPKAETPNRNNGECSEQKDETTPEDENKPKMPKDDLKFSFELLPKSEPWYQTFKRQDNVDIIYTCTSDPGYCTNFFLPYQLPFIIPLDSQKCISDYHRKKRSYLNPESETRIEDTSATPVDDGSSVSFSDQLEETASAAGCSTSDVVDGESTSTSLTISEVNVQTIKPMVGRRRKRKSRFLKMGQMHPRKSPRQHASTLAILSSLIQQRKKRERKSQGDSDASRTSLPSIPEEETLIVPILSEEEKLQQEQEQAALTKVIDDILNTPMDDLSEIEQNILDEDIERIEIKHNQDCIELIHTFEDSNFSPFFRRRGRRGRYPRSPLYAKFSPLSLNSTSAIVRNIRRKRKKNRTGWPKKKRLFVVKKAEQKDEKVTKSISELDDSRLTEISMEENREIEMCELEQQNNVNSDNNMKRICAEQEIVKVTESEVIVSDKETEETNENKIQGVSNCTERLNNVNIIGNSLESSNNKATNVLAENLNNNSVADNIVNDDCDDKDNAKNNGVLVNNVLVSKISAENNMTNEDTAVPDASPKQQQLQHSAGAKTMHIPEKEQSNNTMIKVSVSTDFSSNKVHTSPKKSDTVYSVTILDCKKSVVDGKKVDSREEAGVKDKWEVPERVMHYQPFVRVQKIDNSTSAAGALQNANRRLRSSSSPSPDRKPKLKRAKIAPPTSPRSPRKLRAPRGKWYRER